MKNGAKKIRFDIASWGGDTSAMHDLCDRLAREKIPYDTRAILTSSAASLFFLTGENRQVMEGGTISFHGSAYLVMPNDVDKEGRIGLFMLEAWKDQCRWVEDLYKLRTKFDSALIQKILSSRQNFSFNADQAVRAGIAEAIVK